MSDQLLLENMLLILKSNMEVYVHGTLESSNKNTRNALEFGLQTTLKLQEDLYNKMTECGWYQVKNVEAKTINQTYQKVNKN